MPALRAPGASCAQRGAARLRSLRAVVVMSLALWLAGPTLAASGTTAPPLPAAPTPASAVTPAATPTPLTAAQTERLRHLSEELRCLVCQNQSLADSNADLAVDLRNQVRDMVAQDLDDARIKSYLVERYGDFVLFKPPVQGNTWFLWVGPFVLLAIGLLIWSRLGRRRSAAGAGRTDEAGPIATAGSPAPGRDPGLAAARRLLDDPEP